MPRKLIIYLIVVRLKVYAEVYRVKINNVGQLNVKTFAGIDRIADRESSRIPILRGFVPMR